MSGKISINTRVMLYILLSIPFLLDSNIMRLNMLSLFLYRGIKYFSMAIILITFILKMKITKIDILIFLYEIHLVIATLFQGADIERAIKTVYPVVFYVMLFEIGMDYYHEFIKAQCICYLLIVIINLMTEIIFPHGMYIAEITGYWQEWFLGYYNNHSIYYIAGFCMVFLSYIVNKDNFLSPVIYSIVVVISSVLTWSGGVLGTLLVMALLFIISSLINSKMLNYATYWMIPPVFIGITVVFHQIVQINRLMHIVQSLFGKGGSFIARLGLWRREITYISQHPVMGHGIENAYTRLRQYGWGLHTHNLILEIIHQGGIIGILLFISLIVLSGRELLSCRDTKVINVVSIAFLGWIIATLVEPFTDLKLITLFVVAYRSSEIVNKRLKDNSSKTEEMIMNIELKYDTNKVF